MANEKLIYASAARKAILKADPKLAHCIDSVPGVDAVEVVRCCKCKHWTDLGNGYGRCRHLRYHIEDEIDPTTTHNSFCDRGEGREGE